MLTEGSERLSVPVISVGWYCVSLEDLRLLKLEAKVEVIALNVAFFLGSGSALPLFLS